MGLRIFLFAALVALASAQFGHYSSIRYYNLENCIKQAPIVVGGRTIKNVCQLNQQLNYNDARAACAAQGMDLFYPETTAVFTAFQTYVRNNFGTNTTCTTSWPVGCGLWMNGKYLNDSMNDPYDGYIPYDPMTGNPISGWYAKLGNRTFAINPSSWPMAINAAQNNPGKCKVVKMLSNGVGTNNWNCASLFSPICEYNNTFTFPYSTVTTCTTQNQGKRFYDTTRCRFIDTARDDCGNLIKGICEPYDMMSGMSSGSSMPMAVSNNMAIETCRSMGMDLYYVETNATFRALVNFVNTFHPELLSYTSMSGYSPYGFWIAGRRVGPNINDYVRVKDKSLVPMSVQDTRVWINVVQNSSSSSGMMMMPFMPGPCLGLVDYNGWTGVDTSCDQGMFYPVCEFGP